MNYLIVGLGNPGAEYEHTRHNIGWDVIDRIADEYRVNFQNKFKGLYGSFKYEEDTYYLLKPHTYMNLSGESVKPLMSFFKVPLDNILVIHDELDLNYGVMAFKNGGGLAGHNGLKSIAKHLGSQNFKRLRLGIGRPKHGDVSNWVLSRYSDLEESYFEDYDDGVFEGIQLYIRSGFDRAANKFSKKKVIALE